MSNRCPCRCESCASGRCCGGTYVMCLPAGNQEITNKILTSALKNVTVGEVGDSQKEDELGKLSS